MEIKIACKNNLLHATVIKATDKSNDWLVFISGGNTTLGKARYHDWQLQLRDKQVNSVAFNYSGVAGSGDTLENSSLQERINETLAVLYWIKQQSAREQNITLFASSMSGYIGLGAIDKATQLINTIILYAPAAYSTDAHSLKFDGSFTREIRKDNSWETSLSFAWFKNIQQPTLMFAPENDDVIPRRLTKRYVSLGKDKPLFTHITLPHCPHNCWNNDENSNLCRDKIFQHLLNQLELIKNIQRQINSNIVK